MLQHSLPAYLPSCVYYSNSCVYYNKGRCLVYLSNTSNTIEENTKRAAKCSTYMDSAENVCGYIASANHCLDKSCDDFLSKTNDADCKAYLPTCYLSGDSTCAAIGTGDCDTYEVLTNSDFKNASYCNSQLDASGNACGYVASASKCSTKSCFDVFPKGNDAAYLCLPTKIAPC